MSTGLSRIDELLAKARVAFKEHDAPPAGAAPAPEAPPKHDEPEKREPEAEDEAPNVTGQTIEKTKLSADAQDFISKKIAKLDKEGYPQKQAIAIAYSMARKAGFDVPEAPSEGDEAPEKDAPKDEPEKKADEPKDEFTEAMGIDKRAYNAAKVELNTYNEFLAKYRDGAEDSFDTAIAEGDLPITAQCKQRPTPEWFAEAVRRISADESVNDPAELAAWIWTNWIPKDTRKRIVGR